MKISPRCGLWSDFLVKSVKIEDDGDATDFENIDVCQPPVYITCVLFTTVNSVDDIASIVSPLLLWLLCQCVYVCIDRA